jgi:type IV secretory pathway VirB3-like protein
MVNMRSHSKKVHRSLLQRDLLFGVPTAGLMLVVILFMMFVYFLKMYFMLPVIVILYIIMRHLTSKDSWMIDMILDNIQQKDVFIP